MPSHLHLFKKYLNPIFIETGSFLGEGIAFALQAGYQVVNSIEIFDRYYYENLERYKNVQNLILYHGPTEKLLKYPIVRIPMALPITYWLDAHYSNQNADGSETPRSDVNCPVLKELEIIRQSGRQHDTIMIDDMRCCGTPLFDNITRSDLEKAVLAINPNYEIVYEDSWDPKDILCARVMP